MYEQYAPRPIVTASPSNLRSICAQSLESTGSVTQETLDFLHSGKWPALSEQALAVRFEISQSFGNTVATRIEPLGCYSPELHDLAQAIQSPNASIEHLEVLLHEAQHRIANVDQADRTRLEQELTILTNVIDYLLAIKAFEAIKKIMDNDTATSEQRQEALTEALVAVQQVSGTDGIALIKEYDLWKREVRRANAQAALEVAKVVLSNSTASNKEKQHALLCAGARIPTNPNCPIYTEFLQLSSDLHKR